ncbi:MAG: DUF547 domain-containing protein [Candidatus Omnitrophica bacterium]|nr:DUF547 domain-containing protein [Candidatus Omnitrophota bacterium]
MKIIILGVLMLVSVGMADAQAAFDRQYTRWQEVLTLYTHNGRVNYKALKENDDELKASIQAVEGVSKVDLASYDINQRKVFWINAYNMSVIKTIIDHHPIKRGFDFKMLIYPSNSIQQIANVWDKPVLHVLGRELSLNDIENKILRPEFKDPRIHFAIVCASTSCPVIRPEAYTAEKLDQQLADQIRLFLSDPSKVKYDNIKDTIYLSPIFKWFNADFQQTGGIIAFIKKYAPAGLYDEVSNRTQIQWLGYDWNLNEEHSK